MLLYNIYMQEEKSYLVVRMHVGIFRVEQFSLAMRKPCMVMSLVHLESKASFMSERPAGGIACATL